eukprot:gene2777-761_t
MSPLAGHSVYNGAPAESDYDVYTLGHRGMQAFVSWPYGVAEKNPAGVLGHSFHDTGFNFLAWRDRWRDHEDTLVTWMMVRPQSPDMTHGHSCDQAPGGAHGEPQVSSLGVRVTADVQLPKLPGSSKPHSGSAVFNNSQLLDGHRLLSRYGGGSVDWVTRDGDGTSSAVLNYFQNFTAA